MKKKMKKICWLTTVLQEISVRYFKRKYVR